jgi:hypothetical protein
MRNAAWAFLAGLALLGAWPAGAAAESAVLRGTVRNGKGDRLPGVRVQVFLDGFPLASARSDSLGSYRMVFPWAEAADSTVVACWTAEESSLIPAVAMLRESTAARRMGLWDAAIPRIAAPVESVYDPILCGRGTVDCRSAVADTLGSGAAPENQPDKAPAGN